MSISQRKNNGPIDPRSSSLELVNAIRSNAPEDLGGDIGMDQNQWLAVRDDDDKYNK
jgi:hypothetical protein